MKFVTLAAVALSVLAVPAGATTIQYNDFSDTTGLAINGNAAVATDASSRQVLRVTRATGSQAGSAFSTNPVTLGPDVSFSTRFTFNFNAPVNGGADGLVFVVQTNSNNVGGLGGGIGYEGITNSVGIEFDNWNNGGCDGNNANHVGINLNGSSCSVARSDNPGFTFDQGGDLTAWVDYDGSTNTLEVRLSNALRPVDALLSYNVDLAAILGNPNAFVGFTSGTGAAAANHDVISWEFRDTYAPVDVPEPAMLGLFGMGALGLGLARRRK